MLTILKALSWIRTHLFPHLFPHLLPLLITITELLAWARLFLTPRTCNHNRNELIHIISDSFKQEIGETIRVLPRSEVFRLEKEIRDLHQHSAEYRWLAQDILKKARGRIPLAEEERRAKELELVWERMIEDTL